MIDIKATDFMRSFDVTKATVGVIGHGYVGQAVDHFFSKKCRVLVYDLAKPERQSLKDVVRESELIFVCVPTPMRGNGTCHTVIVEGVISSISRLADEIGRPSDEFVVIVKSTVWPGFTESMIRAHPNMRILFSPEFLTEKNSLQDFEKCNRVILGGDVEDARIVYKYFEGIIPERLDDNRTIVAQCKPTVAEMTKLYANGILMAKVLFSNEVHQICKKLKIEYEEVRVLAVLDPRIGAGHTIVPGPDGQLGAGGHCFPKDINNLRATARRLGTDERILTAIIERNDELREDKDWLRMKDRAVTDG